ncbi:hypothetical protein V6N12_065670 [Hibiscus sabdariffa]|uniref:Uncharacterized protein n=1 Tax=Hibiscus sabdariffa TaxID=183260 RepID=A0ABR2GA61_9ROSI
MPWQYQPSYEHSNPLEQMFPTFTTSFDRLLEEMQNLNKSMEARLVKMDERMINWGRYTSVMDNMPNGTEIPRQEDAAKSDASANSTESDAENDTITLMLKHEPINYSHPQFSRQPCGIKEAFCPGSTRTARPGSEETARHGSKQASCLGNEEPVCPGSTEATCPGREEIVCPGRTDATCLGSTETARLGSKQAACLGNEEPVCPGSTEATCPGSEETACPGSTETAHHGSKQTTRPGNIEEFCHGGEQNDCFVSTYLSDKMTDYLENKAHSMVIPPTICAAPQSLLMEMFKKSKDNDTWKIDDFKKNVPSIDFHRILAEDCHGNWLEQQLPQQRRLHPTMLEVNANEVIKWLDVVIIFPNHMFMPSGTIARWSVYMHFKGEGNKDTSTMAAQREVSEIPLAQVFLGRIVTRWRVQMDYKKYQKWPTLLDSRKFLPTVPATALPPKTDLARRIDRSKRRRLTFMAYPRDINKAIIQVIKDKFPESSTRSQCLNRNLPISLPWHHIPTRQKLDAKEEYRQSLYKTENKNNFTQLRLVDSRNPVEPRLPETGSRWILLHARGAWKWATQN